MTINAHRFNIAKAAHIEPDFAGFAATHAWIGSAVGGVQQVTGGLLQEYQEASVYGRLGGDAFEVHGAIRDAWAAAGSISRTAPSSGPPATAPSSSPNGSWSTDRTSRSAAAFPRGDTAA